MMKYVFILAFLGTSLYASIKTSGIGFDYENATRAERVEWLEYQSDITTSNLNKALRGKHGYNTPFVVTPLSLKGEGFEGDLTSTKAMTRMDAFGERKDLLLTLCPRFQKLPIADHDRQVLLTMRNVDGLNVGRVTVSNGECDRALAKAAQEAGA
ncbi:MAG: hypothetical protein AAGJ85_07970 [Pseudomonadota bacterium]